MSDFASRSDLARVEQRIDGHEDVCAERMKRIDERLASGDMARETMRVEMKSGFSGVYARLWWAAGGIVAGLVAVIVLLVQFLRVVPA